MKAYLGIPISPLIPEELLLWREKESIEDLPQMGALIGAIIGGIKPFVEKKMKRKSEREWWVNTFAAMESVGDQLKRIHSLFGLNELRDSDFVKVRSTIEGMIEQIASPTDNLPSAEQITRELE